MLVDLHVTIPADESAFDTQAFLDRVKTAGLDGVVVTSGDGVFPTLTALKQAAGEKGVSVFVGARIPTTNGVLLALIPDPSSAPSLGGVTNGLYDAAQVLEAVERAGGVSIALRPYDRELKCPMGDHIFTLRGLAACETQSGRASAQANALALEAASNLELPCVGTSSANGVDGLGTSATLLRARAATEAELVDLVRRGDCWPVSFSDRAPLVQPQRQGRSQGGRSHGRGRGEGARDAPSRMGGGRNREGQSGGAYGSEGGGRRHGRRRRGGQQNRGRGRPGERGAPRGPVSDDFGNRALPPNEAHVADDFGNTHYDSHDPAVDENIGNRLAPGETPVFGGRARPVIDDDDEDGGNR